MNWKGLLTIIAIGLGIYFIYIWINKLLPNQQKFSKTNTDLSYDVTQPKTQDLINPSIGEIQSSDPQDAIVYDTTYNILVEAPKIPELNQDDIMDDLLEDVDNTTNNDPLAGGTGGADKIENAAKNQLPKTDIFGLPPEAGQELFGGKTVTNPNEVFTKTPTKTTASKSVSPTLPLSPTKEESLATLDSIVPDYIKRSL